jgi:ABC-2 type transport system ATP-binding protein
MDEAEYCGRVGIMQRGRLLAIDSPSALKQSTLPGLTWDVFAQPLLPALNALETCPGVLRAGLVSDHLRAISSSSVDVADLTAYLDAQGIGQIHVTQVETTLEDVFLALSTEQ